MFVTENTASIKKLASFEDHFSLLIYAWQMQKPSRKQLHWEKNTQAFPWLSSCFVLCDYKTCFCGMHNQGAEHLVKSCYSKMSVELNIIVVFPFFFFFNSLQLANIMTSNNTVSETCWNDSDRLPSCAARLIHCEVVEFFGVCWGVRGWGGTCRCSAQRRASGLREPPSGPRRPFQ